MSVINDFLIKVGFDYDDTGAKKTDSALDGMGKKALQVGGVIAGALGSKALTFDFAQEYANLGRYSDRWGLLSEDIVAYDRALQHAGGAQNDFMGTMQRMSSVQAQSEADLAGLIASGAIKGISDQVRAVVGAEDAVRGFLEASQGLNELGADEQQRFIEFFGFSDSEVRLMRKGRGEIEAMAKAEKELLPDLKEATAVSIQFSDEWQDLTQNMGYFSSQVAIPLTTAVAGMMGSMNEFLDSNRDLINGGLKPVGEHIDKIAIALAALGGAMTIKKLSKLLGILKGINKASNPTLPTGAANPTLPTGAAKKKGKGGMLKSVFNKIPKKSLGVATLATTALLARGEFSDSLSKSANDASLSSEKREKALSISDLLSTSPMLGADSFGFSRASQLKDESELAPQAQTQPIVIQNQITLDGNVMKEFINKTNEETYSEIMSLEDSNVKG